MQTESTVGVLPGELAQVVESVFETMMNLEVNATDKSWLANEDCLTSAVHLAGDWNGVLLLECDRTQACRFAGRFLSAEPAATVEDIVRDVLGELANMIGGNLKCVLSRGIRLSMPSVLEGSECLVRFCGSKNHERLAFACEDGIFWISLITTKT